MLTQSFGGETMTVAEATLIADNALEHTVRCILDALLASEILKSTKGAPYTTVNPCLAVQYTHDSVTSPSCSTVVYLGPTHVSCL